MYTATNRIYSYCHTHSRRHALTISILTENRRSDISADRVSRRVELRRHRGEPARQAAAEARQSVIDADLDRGRMVGAIGEAAGIDGVAIAAPDAGGQRQDRKRVV